MFKVEAITPSIGLEISGVDLNYAFENIFIFFKNNYLFKTSEIIYLVNQIL